MLFLAENIENAESASDSLIDKWGELIDWAQRIRFLFPICVAVVAFFISLFCFNRKCIKAKKIFLFSVVEDFGEMSRLASFLDDYTNFICKMEDQYLSKRTMHARKKKAEMGGFAGGRNPYGYSLVNGTLVINEKEAYCVKRVFLLRSTGMKLIDIADLLNEAGYRTQTGKSFTPSTIQNILKHEAFYRGQLKHSQETYIGDYPRILD